MYSYAKKSLALSVAAILTLLLLLSACSKGAENAGGTNESADASSSNGPTPTAPQTSGQKLPRVAFIFIGDPKTGAWDYTHDQGRQYMEKELGIASTVVTNVSESDVERVATELAADHDIIFGTSFGFMDAMYNVAQKFPNVKFMHASGYKTAPNLSNYLGREYESTYLVGMAAGKMTKNNHIGYVAAFPIPEVLYSINAFMLGAQSVNPDVDLQIVWTNTWADPTIERQAAISLIQQGVDVLGSYQDTTAPVQTAEEYGVYSIGYDKDMGAYAPEKYITNQVWNWGPYYVNVVKSVMDGTWKSEAYYGSMKDGVTDIAPFGKNVPQDVRDLVEKKKAEMIDGTFTVFKGPILDQNGNVKVEAGKEMTHEEILSMNWLVKGIKGTLPQ